MALLPLFDGVPMNSAYVAEPELTVRKRGRSRAFAKADKTVLANWTRILMETGRSGEAFGAWDITARYVARYGPLGLTETKALGGLVASLLEEKIIVEAGTGRRPNGNIAAVYELKR